MLSGSPVDPVLFEIGDSRGCVSRGGGDCGHRFSHHQAATSCHTPAHRIHGFCSNRGRGRYLLVLPEYLGPRGRTSATVDHGCGQVRLQRLLRQNDVWQIQGEDAGPEKVEIVLLFE